MATPHILVVDDDSYIVESLRASLEARGYRVTSAGGCREALGTLAKTDKVDLVILDYLMPDGPATDLLRSIGQDATLQRPPVIMASAFLDPTAPIWERLQKCLPAVSQKMIQAYVSKPYTAEGMDIALHEVLGGDYLPEARSTHSKNRNSFA